MTRDQIIDEAVEMARDRFEDWRWNFWSRTWVEGVFWVGVTDLNQVSDHPEIDRALLKMGEKSSRNMDKWSLSYVKEEEEPHHADDMMIAQAFIDYYVESEDQDPQYIADSQRRIALATEEILSEERAEKAAGNEDLGWKEGIVWYWCDALFMAPVAHIRMSEVTGDPRYTEAMHVAWKRTSDLLYDPEEHLYFRDARFFDMETENGKKVFWSRGNGWVFAALARVLTFLPEDDPNRPFYVNQFKEMAQKLASIQQPDGSWAPSLLDPEEFPSSEASGTAFFCYGMAWGINNGILDSDTYRPVVERAWGAMMAAHRANILGHLGYVQGVGDRPSNVFAQWSAAYGDGAFLMAAVQLAEMAPINIPPLPPISERTDYPDFLKRKIEKDKIRAVEREARQAERAEEI